MCCVLGVRAWVPRSTVKVFVPLANTPTSATCPFDGPCSLNVTGVGFPDEEDSVDGVAFVSAYLVLNGAVLANTAAVFRVRAAPCY